MNRNVAVLFVAAILVLCALSSAETAPDKAAESETGKLFLTQSPDVPISATPRIWILSGLLLCAISLTYFMWPRKQRIPPLPAPQLMPPAINVADQFQILVDVALKRALKLDEKLRLEELMFQLWREKLNLPCASTETLLSAMSKHGPARQMTCVILPLLYSDNAPVLMKPINVSRLGEAVL